MTESVHFDEETAYDEKIAPLMTQIIAVCREHRIPMVAKFQYANRAEEGPLFCTTTIPIEGRTSEEMDALIDAMLPVQPVMLAETRTTDPVTGKVTILIRRV